jgi:chorismate mutase/prephenate dehydrogenase
MLNPKTITLVGGQGQMGQCFYRWWRSLGYEVRILDREDWPRAQTLLSDVNAVVVSVPIHISVDVIDALADLVPEDAILADFTSVKVEPLQAMLAIHNGPVVGLHPMFGPTVDQPAGQTMVVTPGRYSDQYQWLIDGFEQLGFHCHMVDAKEHDRAMDFIQGLEHFMTIALGRFLQQQQVSIESLLALSSPIYRTKINLLGRIFDQNAQLYQDIITASDSRLATITDFLNSSQALLAETQADPRALAAQFRAVAKWMGTFTERAQAQTDALLNRH